MAGLEVTLASRRNPHHICQFVRDDFAEQYAPPKAK